MTYQKFEETSIDFHGQQSPFNSK